MNGPDELADGALTATWVGAARVSDHAVLLVEVEFSDELERARELQRQGVVLPTRGRWQVGFLAGEGLARLDAFIPTGEDAPDLHAAVAVEVARWGKALLTAARLGATVCLIEDANEADLGARAMVEDSVEVADTPWEAVEAALGPLHAEGVL